MPILAKTGGKYTMDTSLDVQREIVFWLNTISGVSGVHTSGGGTNNDAVKVGENT